VEQLRHPREVSGRTGTVDRRLRKKRRATCLAHPPRTGDASRKAARPGELIRLGEGGGPSWLHSHTEQRTDIMPPHSGMGNAERVDRTLPPSNPPPAPPAVKIHSWPSAGRRTRARCLHPKPTVAVDGNAAGVVWAREDPMHASGRRTSCNLAAFVGDRGREAIAPAC
jgi:hypothetical protein